MQSPPQRPTPSSTRIWLAVGLAIVISYAVFASSARRMLSLDEMAPPSLKASGFSRPVDFRWSLHDLDGNAVDFAKYKGRPILLNLWASWCDPCLKEMPSIVKLAASKELEGSNIAFLCVSSDESADALRQFMKDKDWDVTVLRATSIPPSFQTEGIPATFLITPNGDIAAAELGAAQWDDPSVVAFLRKMAASKK